MSKIADATDTDSLETLGRELWAANGSARGIWGNVDSFLRHMVFSNVIFPAVPSGMIWGRLEEDGIDYYPRCAFDLVD